MTGSEPAFPEVHISHWKGKDPEVGETDNVLPRWHGGLTKREYFAAMAMQAFVIATTEKDACSSCEDYEIAEMAISQADALIEELNK